MQVSSAVSNKSTNTQHKPSSSDQAPSHINTKSDLFQHKNGPHGQQM